jgi:hypothetical protein
MGKSYIGSPSSLHVPAQSKLPQHLESELPMEVAIAFFSSFHVPIPQLGRPYARSLQGFDYGDVVHHFAKLWN